MTSGTFSTQPISSIYVERSERQRKELLKIDELAESINRIGLINPIVIETNGKLVAGERRLTACKQLGWTDIPVQFVEDLSEYELQSIELEENVKRVDLTWQEEVEAVARFHKLKEGHEEGWTKSATAAALGLSPQAVGDKLSVAAHLDKDSVGKSDRYSTALNIVRRDAERKKTSVLSEVAAAVVKPVTKYDTLEADPEVEAILEKSENATLDRSLLNVSFHDWQADYTGPKFNLIHCDFPYGINVADAPRMSASIKDHYDDSPDIYWALLARLALAMENVVADSAHLIFWHSMKFHTDTKMELERMGWTVNPFPLIWHKSDGSGIPPDPQRGPRQTYEAAFFCSRGDRKLTEAGCRANSFAFPGRREGAIHVSEKPYKMLEHFLGMVCDEYSTVLDPTAGSANAIKVAEDLGAHSFLGLEQSEEFYNIARDNWNLRG